VKGFPVKHNGERGILKKKSLENRTQKTNPVTSLIHTKKKPNPKHHRETREGNSLNKLEISIINQVKDA